MEQCPNIEREKEKIVVGVLVSRVTSGKSLFGAQTRCLQEAAEALDEWSPPCTPQEARAPGERSSPCPQERREPPDKRPLAPREPPTLTAQPTQAIEVFVCTPERINHAVSLGEGSLLVEGWSWVKGSWQPARRPLRCLWDRFFAEETKDLSTYKQAQEKALAAGILWANPQEFITLCQDKWESFLLFHQENIATPPTILLTPDLSAAQFNTLEQWDEIYVKPRFGHKGQDMTRLCRLAPRRWQHYDLPNQPLLASPRPLQYILPPLSRGAPLILQRSLRPPTKRAEAPPPLLQEFRLLVQRLPSGWQITGGYQRLPPEKAPTANLSQGALPLPLAPQHWRGLDQPLPDPTSPTPPSSLDSAPFVGESVSLRALQQEQWLDFAPLRPNLPSPSTRAPSTTSPSSPSSLPPSPANSLAPSSPPAPLAQQAQQQLNRLLQVLARSLPAGAGDSLCEFALDLALPALPLPPHLTILEINSKPGRSFHLLQTPAGDHARLRAVTAPFLYLAHTVEP